MMELTKEQIDEGALLIAALDGSGLSPRAALWFHQPEHRRWKLVLAEEGVDARGPLAVLADVGRVLESLGETISHIKLYDVSLRGIDEPLIRSLTRAEARGPSLAGMRLMGDFVEDRIIEDAYIYRLRKPAA